MFNSIFSSSFRKNPCSENKKNNYKQRKRGIHTFAHPTFEALALPNRQDRQRRKPTRWYEEPDMKNMTWLYIPSASIYCCLAF